LLLGLLLLLLAGFVHSSHAAQQTAHRSSRRGASARIARNRSADRAHHCAACGAFDNLAAWLRTGWGGSGLGSTRVKSGLLHRPSVTLVAVFRLLLLALTSATA